MITVIIPTLNEQATISQVVQLVEKSKSVTEILVIDDKSIDNTIRNARSDKVKIYTSTRLGKGASMLDGMLLSNNEIIVYLDADILTFPENIIEILTEPIISDKADFVKSYFNRQAGRVTELVAKPLLSLLFPEIAHYSQPLSGMIASQEIFPGKSDF